MACFDNLIGIDNQCSDVAPDSGVYLKDIGITSTELNRLITSDYENGITFGEEKIASAVKLVVNDFHSVFGGQYKARTILESQRIGFHDRSNTLKAAAAEMRGVEVDIYNEDSFVDLYIRDVSLYSNYTGNVSIKIYDGLTGVLQDTITLAAVAGRVSVADVNKKYKSNRKRLSLVIAYDATGIGSYATYLRSGGCEGCDGEMNYRPNMYVLAKSIKYDLLDSVTYSNIDSNTHTAGLSVNYSIVCNHEDWLCQYRDLMAIPIAYRAAQEIMSFAIDNSDRLNTTSVNLDNLKARRQFYATQYNQRMKALIENMVVPSDARCYECNKPAFIKTIIP